MWQAKSNLLLRRLFRPRDRADWLNVPTPTADIYFLNAMRGSVEPDGPVKRHGPNVFEHSGVFVVLRYANEAELQRLEAARRSKVYYVVDDDLHGLSQSAELPFGYRYRLARFRRRLLPRIMAMDPTVVAPNQLILDKFPAHKTQLLHPAYCAVRQQFDHFEASGPTEIVFTGTRSHLRDLEEIVPALDRLCASFPDMRLTTFLGSSLPRALKRRANVSSHPALDWPGYREHLLSAGYHLAIAPFRRTSINECRSHNKIHDHAAFGAASLYGDIKPYRDIITDGVNGYLLPSEATAWLERLTALVRDREGMRRVAEKGAALSLQLGEPRELALFWRPKLGL